MEEAAERVYCGHERKLKMSHTKHISHASSINYDFTFVQLAL
jgi:hypothetical protein